MFMFLLSHVHDSIFYTIVPLNLIPTKKYCTHTSYTIVNFEHNKDEMRWEERGENSHSIGNTVNIINMMEQVLTQGTKKNTTNTILQENLSDRISAKYNISHSLRFAPPALCAHFNFVSFYIYIFCRILVLDSFVFLHIFLLRRISICTVSLCCMPVFHFTRNDVDIWYLWSW